MILALLAFTGGQEPERALWQEEEKTGASFPDESAV
jgi:hypothetical protein